MFEARGWSDYLFWQATDRKMLDRVNMLLKEAARAPFTGIGKPEPLRGTLSGCWSRRIDGEHRLVYRVIGKDGEQRLEVLQCRFHYADR
jgi:toxin YoeB